MRNSWYGTPPQSWEKCRFKDFLRLITDRSYSNNKVGLENIESGTGQYIKTDTEFEGNGIAFKENDLLYGKLRPYLQKVYDAEFKGNAIGDIYVFRCKQKAHHLFIKYVLLSDSFTTITNSVTAGAKMPRVSADFILGLPFCLPNLKTQIKISEYLENKNQNINKRVQLLIKKQECYLRLKKSLINRMVCHGLNPNVQMKDSGIRIIGQIPSHWQCKRIKDICSYVNRGCTPSYVEDSNYYVMNQATFSKGYIDISNIRFTDTYRKEAKLLKGDLIMASTGGGVLGKVLYFDKTEDNFIADSHVTIFRDKSNCMKYYFYLFSTQYDMINECLAKGSTNQTELQRDKVLALELPYPPLAEQEAIANYLDDKCSKIDTIVEKISEEINLLGKLKKSLINEVITGKRTV